MATNYNDIATQFGTAQSGTGLAGGSQPYVAPSTSYAQNTGFSDTQNLIGTQIAPTAAQSYAPAQTALTGANQQMQGLNYDFGQANTQYGGALSGLQGAQTEASGMLRGLTGLGIGAFSGGGSASVGGGGDQVQADTSRFGQELDAALSGLQGPDRAALANQAFNLMAEGSQSAYDMALRDAAARNTALGRAGSGMITSSLSDVTAQRASELGRIQQQMALNAAEQSLADRMNIANFQRGIASDRFGGEQFNAGLREQFQGRGLQSRIAQGQLSDAALARAQQGAQFGANFQRGLAGDLYGMGRDVSGLQMDLGDRYGKQASEITGLGERKATFGRNTAMDSADLIGRQNVTDAALRGELRGERDYQNQLSTQAQQDQLGMQNFNEFLRSRGWGEMMGASDLGYGDDPYNAMLNQASNYGQQANTLFGGIGGLMGAAGSLWGGASTPVAGASTGSTPLFDNGYNYPP